MSATFLILIVGLFVAVWLLLIRPQRRRQAAQQGMLERLEVGDEVVTAGGLYGQVEAIEEDEVRLEIAPGTVVRVARRAIAAVLPDEVEEDEEYVDEEPVEQEEPVGEEASSGTTPS